MEFVKTENNGQFSIFKAKNNQVRGHHFHHSKVEKFLVINGKAKFFMKDVSSNKKIEFLLDHREPKVVETIPGWQHYIKILVKKNCQFYYGAMKFIMLINLILIVYEKF